MEPLLEDSEGEKPVLADFDDLLDDVPALVDAADDAAGLGLFSLRAHGARQGESQEERRRVADLLVKENAPPRRRRVAGEDRLRADGGDVDGPREESLDRVGGVGEGQDGQDREEVALVPAREVEYFS